MPGANGGKHPPAAFLSPAHTPAMAALPDPALHPREFLEGLLLRVEATDKENYFKWPVDERVAPGYYAVIKHPICFSNIRQKLAAGAYTSWRSFLADFELIVQNARTFNTSKTRCFKCAVVLQRNLNKILKPAEVDARKAFSVLFPYSRHSDLPNGGGQALAGSSFTELVSDRNNSSAPGSPRHARDAGMQHAQPTAGMPLPRPSLDLGWPYTSEAELRDTSANPGLSPSLLLPLPSLPPPAPFCTALSEDEEGEAARMQSNLQAALYAPPSLLQPPMMRQAPGTLSKPLGLALPVTGLLPLTQVLHQLRVPVVFQAWSSLPASLNPGQQGQVHMHHHQQQQQLQQAQRTQQQQAPQEALATGLRSQQAPQPAGPRPGPGSILQRASRKRSAEELEQAGAGHSLAAQGLSSLPTAAGVAAGATLHTRAAAGAEVSAGAAPVPEEEAACGGAAAGQLSGRAGGCSQGKPSQVPVTLPSQLQASHHTSTGQAQGRACNAAGSSSNMVLDAPPQALGGSGGSAAAAGGSGCRFAAAAAATGEVGDAEQAGSSGRSAAWKAARRPLEWQCRWLELRLHELSSQRRRVQAALAAAAAAGPHAALSGQHCCVVPSLAGGAGEQGLGAAAAGAQQQQEQLQGGAVTAGAGGPGPAPPPGALLGPALPSPAAGATLVPPQQGGTSSTSNRQQQQQQQDTSQLMPQAPWAGAHGRAGTRASVDARLAHCTAGLAAAAGRHLGLQGLEPQPGMAGSGTGAELPVTAHPHPQAVGQPQPSSTVDQGAGLQEPGQGDQAACKGHQQGQAQWGEGQAGRALRQGGGVPGVVFFRAKAGAAALEAAGETARGAWQAAQWRQAQAQAQAQPAAGQHDPSSAKLSLEQMAHLSQPMQASREGQQQEQQQEQQQQEQQQQEQQQGQGPLYQGPDQGLQGQGSPTPAALPATSLRVGPSAPLPPAAPPLPLSLLPAAALVSLEVMEQQLAELRRSLQAAFNLPTLTPPTDPTSSQPLSRTSLYSSARAAGLGSYPNPGSTGPGAAPGFKRSSQGGMRRPGQGLTINTGRGGQGGALGRQRTEQDQGEPGSWAFAQPPHALKDKPVSTITIPPVRELPEAELTARVQAYTQWNADYKARGAAALAEPPPAVAAVLAACRRARRNAGSVAAAAAPDPPPPPDQGAAPCPTPHPPTPTPALPGSTPPAHPPGTQPAQQAAPATPQGNGTADQPTTATPAADPGLAAAPATAACSQLESAKQEAGPTASQATVPSASASPAAAAAAPAAAATASVGKVGGAPAPGPAEPCVSDADSSSEDTSDELYSRMHALLAEEAYRKYEAWLATQPAEGVTTRRRVQQSKQNQQGQGQGQGQSQGQGQGQQQQGGGNGAGVGGTGQGQGQGQGGLSQQPSLPSQAQAKSRRHSTGIKSVSRAVASAGGWGEGGLTSPQASASHDRGFASLSLPAPASDSLQLPGQMSVTANHLNYQPLSSRQDSMAPALQLGSPAPLLLLAPGVALPATPAAAQLPSPRGAAAGGGAATPAAGSRSAARPGKANASRAPSSASGNGDAAKAGVKKSPSNGAARALGSPSAAAGHKGGTATPLLPPTASTSPPGSTLPPVVVQAGLKGGAAQSVASSGVVAMKQVASPRPGGQPNRGPRQQGGGGAGGSSQRGTLGTGPGVVKRQGGAGGSNGAVRGARRGRLGRGRRRRVLDDSGEEDEVSSSSSSSSSEEPSPSCSRSGEEEDEEGTPPPSSSTTHTTPSTATPSSTTSHARASGRSGRAGKGAAPGAARSQGCSKGGPPLPALAAAALCSSEKRRPSPKLPAAAAAAAAAAAGSGGQASDEDDLPLAALAAARVVG